MLANRLNDVFIQARLNYIITYNLTALLVFFKYYITNLLIS